MCKATVYAFGPFPQGAKISKGFCKPEFPFIKLNVNFMCKKKKVRERERETERAREST